MNDVYDDGPNWTAVQDLPRPQSAGPAPDVFTAGPQEPPPNWLEGEEPLADGDLAWKLMGGGVLGVAAVAGGIWLVPLIGATGAALGAVAMTSAGYAAYRGRRAGRAGAGTFLPNLLGGSRRSGPGSGRGGLTWPRLGGRGGRLGGLGLSLPGSKRKKGGKDHGLPGFPGFHRTPRTGSTSAQSRAAARQSHPQAGGGSSWRPGRNTLPSSGSAREAKKARKEARRQIRELERDRGERMSFRDEFRRGAETFSDWMARRAERKAEQRLANGGDPNVGALSWKAQQLLDQLAALLAAPAQEKPEAEPKKGKGEEQPPAPEVNRKPSPNRRTGVQHSTMDQEPWVDPQRPVSRVSMEAQLHEQERLSNPPGREPVPPPDAAPATGPAEHARTDDEVDGDFGHKAPVIPPQHRLDKQMSHPIGLTVAQGLLDSLAEAHQNLFAYYQQQLEDPTIDPVVDMDAFVRGLGSLYSSQFSADLATFADWIDGNYPAPGLGDYFRSVTATMNATGNAATEAADAARGGLQLSDWDRRTAPRPGEAKANIPA